MGTVAPPIMSGYPEFVFAVTRRLGCKYLTLDIMPGANIQADIKTADLAAQCFDTVVCISTLEHITTEAWKALWNMLRIGKRVLLTLPFGFAHDMPWGRQYDSAMLAQVLTVAFEVGAGKYDIRHRIIDEAAYQHSWEGWVPCQREDLLRLPYGSNGADGATGVLCLEIAPPPEVLRENG